MTKQDIRCSECGEHFVPTDEDWQLIQELGQSGADLAMIHGTKCFESVDCNPLAVIGGAADAEPEERELLRCPTRQCIGWVTNVEESPGTTFWGCGECGNAWRKRHALDKAITKIVKRFPHRKGCYVRTGCGWQAADEDHEHPDYEEMVEDE